MFYLDAAKLIDLIAEAGKSHDDFLVQAGISKQAFYRILFNGGPIMISTLKKVSSALGVSAASLLDHERTPPGGVDAL